ncbi:hypothetical protein NDU88_000368 [Pleurodeles waltl]|uniref:long-chain-fatty-acid--CoA ligase n=2 Tax=Pleurodeles waltl TaxID=8319 RepID=A0AAV7WFB6_PLEWA|nr:hypothetical protein NDU88_000368 [Pleurodeles waltl]
MALNGAVNVKEECTAQAEGNWLEEDDYVEEAYESFDNISPCKNEDLQSPAVAGHGIFQSRQVYEDTASMMIIHGVDPTQLEVTSGEICEILDAQADAASPGKCSDTSLIPEPALLVDSTVSSVSLNEDTVNSSSLSEKPPLENGASGALPVVLVTTVAEAPLGTTSRRFPKNFVVSAESTPLKPHEQELLFTKAHLHDYVSAMPAIASIEGSLELSAESSLMGGRSPRHQDVEVNVGEVQTCQELKDSFETMQRLQWHYKENPSAGSMHASMDMSLEVSSVDNEKCLQEKSPEHASSGPDMCPKELDTECLPVEETPSNGKALAGDLSGLLEQSGADGYHSEMGLGNGAAVMTEEMFGLNVENPCMDEVELNVIQPQEQTATEMREHILSFSAERLTDAVSSCEKEGSPCVTSQDKGELTSIAVDHGGLLETKLEPASSYWTTERDGAVKLRMEATGPAADTPITVHQMFQRTIQCFGDRPALAQKKDGVWETITYREYHQQCRAAAKSFLKLGLERYHGVGILGFNSPQWFIADVGAIMAGGFAVGIYTTNSPEACQYVAGDSNANILVVENHRQLAKILQIQHQLPHLKAIVQYQDELKERRPNLYTWKEFIQLGADVPDAQLDDIIASQKANQCCILIYTSGTTGQPKGAMLSHDNLTWVVKQACKVLNFVDQEVLISYLPLSHVAAQVVDLWLPIFSGGTTYFADPDALKGSLITTLREVRPTGFLGVPRVWEKIQERMKALGAKSSLIQRKVAAWAKSIGLQASYNRMNGISSMPWGYTLANILVFRRVHAALGLDRCTRCYSGAAPIMRDTLEFFMSLNLPVLELYGMSESSGPHTMCVPSAFRIMSTGKEIPGCRTQIYRPVEDGTGEICFWGRHIFMGYLNMEEKTKEALDEEGWLHSGDLGKHDKDGYLYITGRIKELIITAGGENIPPIPIEDAIKEELPIISNAMLIGDKMKFLSMLLTLKCKVDADTGDPKDELTPEAVEFCQRLGSSATRVSEVVSAKDPAVYQAIQEGLERVNRRATSNAQRVQKWSVLGRDFSVSGGELGPTLKLKRPVVLKMYKEEIENFYKD